MESTAAQERSAGAVSADAGPAAAVSATPGSADAAFEAVVAAVAVLAELRRRQREEPAGPDPLRHGVDGSLDRLAAISRLEASTAAFKVLTAAEYTDATTALTPPDASPQENTAHEMAAITELACILTVSEPNAATFLSTSRRLTTALPLTLAALQTGTLSWQHARTMVDETLNLDPAGAQALEAH
ncbi:HNH endonuclease, partial [Pseudarthrobacter sp. TAF60_1]